MESSDSLHLIIIPCDLDGSGVVVEAIILLGWLATTFVLARANVANGAASLPAWGGDRGGESGLAFLVMIRGYFSGEHLGFGCSRVACMKSGGRFASFAQSSKGNWGCMAGRGGLYPMTAQELGFGLRGFRSYPSRYHEQVVVVLLDIEKDDDGK